MVRKRFAFGAALVALLVLLWAMGNAVAGPPLEGPGGDVSIAATVGSKISYQGVLKESGSLVTGSRDMTFRLYSDDTCSTQVGSDIVKSGVQVTDGLFSVDLAVTHSDFNGQGLWLEVEVGGTKIGCQELLPVPYALSLRPGAVISSTVSGAILHAENTASNGRGLRGYATATSGTNYGVVGASKSPDGYGGYFYNTASGGTGLYARGIDTGADLVLAGNANTAVGDDGRIFSDPAYTSSDIWLISNDGVRIDLDENGDGEDADFEIRDKDDNLIFRVDESSGVYGYSGGSGDGVHGEATASNKSGVYGHSTEGFGVTGRSTNNNGVQGFSDGVSKYGVYGHKAGTTGAAVYGNNEGSTGSGVIGESTNYVGVWGETDRPDGNYGIRTPDNMYVGGKIDLVGTIDPVIGERFEVDPDDEYEVGDLLVIDPNSPYLVLSTEPNDTKVIGVVGPGVDYKEGELMVIVMGYHGAKPDAESVLSALGKPMVGIAKETATRTVAKITVDASYGAIKRGDLLTTSPTPGHAMKAQPVDVGGVKIHRPGTIIGKAMESLESGRGLIEVFIVLQ